MFAQGTSNSSQIRSHTPLRSWPLEPVAPVAPIARSSNPSETVARLLVHLAMFLGPHAESRAPHHFGDRESGSFLGAGAVGFEAPRMAANAEITPSRICRGSIRHQPLVKPVGILAVRNRAAKERESIAPRSACPENPIKRTRSHVLSSCG
jgi:hypothetical protein